jgi:5-methylcytosine-specific restriction endonuclease McrA
VSRNKRVLEIPDYQICIHTSDGDEDSISWVKSMRQEDYSIEKKLTSSLRYSIENQIRTYRSNHYRTPCQDCGTRERLSVDHINHFEGIVYEFLQLQPDHPKLFSEDPITSQDIFREEDAAYDTLWKVFHETEANLQILCIPCNRARPDWESPVVRQDRKWKPKEGKWK